MPALIVSGITKAFREGALSREVLRGVSLEVAEGELVALVGRSGSGKSTLLNVIAGIDRPSAGRVILGGHEISALDERGRTLLRRVRIGLVFQFFNLIPTLTVEENVRLPLELGRGVGAAQSRASARAMLEAVGLGDRGGEAPDHLSGGEQQRVAIARALVHAPSLVLADEPTGALDAQTGALVLALLVAEARRRRAAVVLVTHSAEVARAADRILVLEDGAVRAGGSSAADGP
jgi:putative ABC transport system ATP-binding protein